jgi:hypothetical protein
MSRFMAHASGFDKAYGKNKARLMTKSWIRALPGRYPGFALIIRAKPG